MRMRLLSTVPFLCFASMGVASAALAASGVSAPAPAQSVGQVQVVENYTRLVLANYSNTYAAAQKLNSLAKGFVQEPTADELKLLREAWLIARASYVQTEAFRFYDGPIEVFPDDVNIPGPESRLDAWPIDASLIDSVKDKPQGGLINSRKLISPVRLRSMNQEDDERHVFTGFHALEFLLWGEDLDKAGPGKRDVKDFIGEELPAKRRRAMLLTLTQMMVEDFQYLQAEWSYVKESKSTNYANRFVAKPQDALTKIFTGLAVLSNFELAEVHLGNALTSKEADYEQDQFSDNTVKDLVGMAQGMKNVITGQYENIKGPSIADLIAQSDVELADALRKQTEQVLAAMRAIPEPFDQSVLASKPDSDGREKVRAAIKALNKESELLEQAAKKLGLKVDVYGY